MDIRLLILDVDGVMTDGGITVDQQGHETKRFHVRDGFAIRMWERAGLSTAIITGRSCAAVTARAKDLRIAHVLQGRAEKASAVGEICAAAGVKPAQAAFLGDDWPDLPAMRAVAYPMAVADAEPSVIAAAQYVTPRPGGHGAVRDAVEHLLAKMGKLEAVRGFYDGRDA